MNMLTAAWDKVSEITVQNCFERAGISKESQECAMNDSDDPFTELDEELQYYISTVLQHRNPVLYNQQSSANLHNLRSLERINVNKQEWKRSGEPKSVPTLRKSGWIFFSTCSGLTIFHLNIQSLRNSAHLSQLRQLVKSEKIRHCNHIRDMVKYKRGLRGNKTRRLQTLQTRPFTQTRRGCMCLRPYGTQNESPERLLLYF